MADSCASREYTIGLSSYDKRANIQAPEAGPPEDVLAGQRVWLMGGERSCAETLHGRGLIHRIQRPRHRPHHCCTHTEESLSALIGRKGTHSDHTTAEACDMHLGELKFADATVTTTCKYLWTSWCAPWMPQTQGAHPETRRKQGEAGLQDANNVSHSSRLSQSRK